MSQWNLAFYEYGCIKITTVYQRGVVFTTFRLVRLFSKNENRTRHIVL